MNFNMMTITIYLKKYLSMVIIFFAFTGIAHGASQGTSGAQFLQIVSSPRAAALGAAFTAFCDDVNCIEFNPGGLAYLTKNEVSLVQNNWIQGVSNQYLAFAMPTSKGTFGLNVVMLNVGGMIRADEQDNEGGTFGATDQSASLAFARSFFNGRFGVGVNVRSINQKIDTQSVTGMSSDLGVVSGWFQKSMLARLF